MKKKLSNEALRDLLCEKPLTLADYRTIYALIPQATPAVSRVLVLLLLLDFARRPGREKKRKG